jgi:hypothetical protein
LDDINWEKEIKYDPGLRRQIDDYHTNHRENVRRKYLENRPCQPRTLDFPVTYIGGAQEDLFQNGLMSLIGLNTVSPKIEHIVFVVSYLEIRRMLVMMHVFYNSQGARNCGKG